MKIIYVLIALLLIIGIGVVVMKDSFKKDEAVTVNDSNQMNESNTNTTTGNISGQTAVNQPVVTPAVVTSSEQIDWDGIYQIVEFGNVVPDSDPMSYDAYGYTDIEIVFMHDKGFEVTISQNMNKINNNSRSDMGSSGTGRINTSGLFEVISHEGEILLTLEHGNFGANKDTRIYWGKTSPLLQTTTNKYFDTLKKDL
jgi:hypothetical protein